MPRPDDNDSDNSDISHAGIERLAALLRATPAQVLSGAGLSTESGIPDYRSPESLERRHEPLRFQEFTGSEGARRRYWARSHAAWRHMRDVQPNAGHRAVTALQRAGLVRGILTQNVDGLHQAAGSRDVIELHGSLSRVRCLACGTPEEMRSYQERLTLMNPQFRAEAARLNPDGDSELTDTAVAGFRPAACLVCGGIMKTDVVFFGENVPRATVERAWEQYGQAEALLVLGSSLAVRSGLRFAERAARDGRPLLIITDGVTRADAIADLKLTGRLGTTLTRLAETAGSAAAAEKGGS